LVQSDEADDEGGHKDLNGASGQTYYVDDMVDMEAADEIFTERWVEKKEAFDIEYSRKHCWVEYLGNRRDILNDFYDDLERIMDEYDTDAGSKRTDWDDIRKMYDLRRKLVHYSFASVARVLRHSKRCINTDGESCLRFIHDLDLRQFKPFNDHLGYGVGDIILDFAEGYLRRNRHHVQIFRYGGDEYLCFARKQAHCKKKDRMGGYTMDDYLDDEPTDEWKGFIDYIEDIKNRSIEVTVYFYDPDDTSKNRLEYKYRGDARPFSFSYNIKGLEVDTQYLRKEKEDTTDFDELIQNVLFETDINNVSGFLDNSIINERINRYNRKTPPPNRGFFSSEVVLIFNNGIPVRPNVTFLFAAKPINSDRINNMEEVIKNNLDDAFVRVVLLFNKMYAEANEGKRLLVNPAVSIHGEECRIFIVKMSQTDDVGVVASRIDDYIKVKRFVHAMLRAMKNKERYDFNNVQEFVDFRGVNLLSEDNQ
jgi:GGDEF domain-containing protein